MEKSVIKDLLVKVKKHNDVASKNKLLEIYYEEAKKWAYKVFKSVLYTDYVKPTESEVDSAVFQAFETSIKNIDIDREGGSMSFKNYLYLMIRYQIYLDLKTSLNYTAIKGFNEEKKILLKSIKEDDERQYINKLDISLKVEKIIEFLGTRKPKYAEIIRLKSKGYKNAEICKLMNVSTNTLKSHLQYIKKLVLEKFGDDF